MGHRFVALPFTASVLGAVRAAEGRATHVVVSNGKISSEIDLVSGVATSVPGVPPKALGATDPAAGLEGLCASVRETATGPLTEVTSLEGEAVASIAGELVRSVARGALLVAEVVIPDDRYDVVVVQRGHAGELRLPGAFRAVLAIEGELGIAVIERDGETGWAHVARATSAGPRAISVSIPRSFLGIDVRLVGAEAVVLAGQTLLVLDLGALSFEEPHRALALRCDAISGASGGLSEPATVLFVLPSMIVAQHPRAGRLTFDRLPTDPPVAAGDAIKIDDAHEPMPGIVKVRAWSTASGVASVRPSSPALELAAPAVAPIDVRLSPTSGRRRENGRVLRAVAARWGFSPPPSLLRFVDATDEDPLLRRRIELLGLGVVEVRHLSIDWSADPCVLALCSLGDGDEHSLYLYPPALARGEEPPVVTYLHELNEVEWSAPSFELFLDRALAARAAEQPELVAAVRARLGVGTTTAEEPVDAPVPEWLRALGESRSLAEVDELEAVGDLLAAERACVAAYVRDDHAARPHLARLYARLGWGAALEVLRLASGEL